MWRMLVEKSMRMMLFLILLLMVVPLTSAQDDSGLSAQEQEWLDTIIAANENLLALDTYHVEMEQNVEQTMSLAAAMTGGMSIDQTITQMIDVQVRTRGDQPDDIFAQIDQTIESTGPTGPLNVELTMETLVLNGQTYLRFTDISQMPGSSALPQEWVALGDTSAETQYFDIGSLANLSEQQQRFLSILDSNTVGSIEQLDSETLEGQTMDVYELIWSTAAFEELAGMLGTSSLQTSADQPAQDLVESLFANASGTQQVWIGTEDGLPHRTTFEMVIEEAEISMQQQTMTLSQTTTSTVNYMDFNGEVTIPSPDIAE